ncbi:hypothetical protein EJ05DRAFT_480865 [Pseudovirgaria hyperparasitica]|uniref:Serine hydrolase domain-containing protein n=1 Tax=Pseudovirgaria hyperparasitica TaxID=470096 RepID=A0A6A6VRL6_9PEZI|nr:uncharacterized protein EJ05DRAFT_480865 [Pseudovirgaria hyperparasitica]KAF2752843.1 hypothetical protein EJ05DRAFT_480865 [Pseudovirgaria hyperparasitica]
MRFLCLHGAGTSSKIFESQTAALRHELGPGHSYHFVQGVVQAPMHRAIEKLSNPADEHFVYYKPSDPISFSKAVTDLGSYVADEGPFDGVMAFSQGTSLASAFMIAKQNRQNGTAPFKCAIFFCGRPPFVDIPDQQATADTDIQLYTAHIWGARDEEPELAPQLAQMCKASKRHVFAHDGGHEIPGGRDSVAFNGTVHVIERMLASVEKSNMRAS